MTDWVSVHGVIVQGYRVASIEKKLGQKSSDTCQIAFEDCAVGADSGFGIAVKA